MMRRAYSLIEVLIALSVSSLILAGLASSLLVAVKAADSAAPSRLAVDSARIADQLASELPYAISIESFSEYAIDFTTADRDGDRVRDLIRYRWSGVPGDPLTKWFNNDSPQIVAPHVNAFRLEMYTAVDATSVVKRIHTPLAVDSHTFTAASAAHSVEPGKWLAQSMSLAEGQVDSSSYLVREVWIKAGQNGPADGTFEVQLRLADADGIPTSTVLASQLVRESELASEPSWYQVVFSDPTRSLNPAARICLVCVHRSGSASALIGYDEDAVAGMSMTKDSGATWTRLPAARLAFRAKATAERLTDITWPRESWSGYRLELRQSEGPLIISGEQLLNRPPLAGKTWETHFDVDPTLVDGNGDSLPDWLFDGANMNCCGPLDTWIASEGNKLVLNPIDPLVGDTTIDVRMRHTTAVGQGAILHVEADWQRGEYAPLEIRLQLQDDGTQVLRLLLEGQDGLQTRVVVPDLPNEIVGVRVVLDPAQDQLFFQVNGQSFGVLEYKTRRQGIRNGPATFLTNDGGPAEFDYFSIRREDVQ